MPDFVIKVLTTADLAALQSTQQGLQAIAQTAGQVAAGTAGATEATGRFTDVAGRLREANGRFVDMGKSVTAVTKDLANAEHAAGGFLSSLELGAGIDIGRRVIDSLAEIPAKFGEAIEEVYRKGIEYNAEMQTMANGLGATFRSVEPEK